MVAATAPRRCRMLPSCALFPSGRNRRDRRSRGKRPAHARSRQRPPHVAVLPVTETPPEPDSGKPGHVDRRLAAILAADVVGYSRLMGVDEEGTLARLKSHLHQLIEPKIAEHRGRTF